MARRQPYLLSISSLLVIFFFSISRCFDLTSPSDSFSIDSIHRQPMIFPLHFKIHNSSSRLHSRNLRQSQLPYARMRLYDDLLANGYYTTRLWIGTPPQEFALIVDTGSTVTYVPCATCKRCGNHQDPRFQPELSSTYQALKCNPDCNCDDEGIQCVYERRYAEMSSSSGVLSEDIVSFGNESELVPQRVTFGCENVETGDLYSQRADGIIGLGPGKLSIVDQLVDKGVIRDSFSLCYGGMDVGGGAMVLGNVTPPADMAFSHSDPNRSPYYNIDLKELHVGGKPLKLNPKIFDGRHGTVLDSGTTYAYLPKEAFISFKDAVIKEIHFLKRIHGPDPHYDDICFSGAGRDVSQLSKIFPEVTMVFGNGQSFSLSPENYLFRHTKVSGAYCLGIFQNADPTTLLGGIVVRNTLVTYDRENDKIGFWKTNCSDLWKNLHLPAFSATAPPPASAPSGQKDTSVQIPPNLAPSLLPQNFLPGGTRVGLITFDMSIRMNNSDPESGFKKLSVSIAHELDIDDTQVRLLSFTNKGDDYFIRWGIFPPHSAEYISNSTLLDIVRRLREHRLQYPERFGSYQLVEWKAGPHMKTWWQKHFVAVGAGVVISLLVCSSVAGIWLVFRRRQQVLGTYQPVGAVIVEQELQPL